MTEKFAKLMAYLKNPVSRRVRTNNHVERTNRMFRFLEKVRYKWRRRRTLVRFVVLTLDEIWKERTTAQAKKPTTQSRQHQARPKVRRGNDLGPREIEVVFGEKCRKLTSYLGHRAIEAWPRRCLEP